MKRGVILANTGSPASPDPADVSVYLEQFLSNPRIVPMNPLVWKQILKRAILPKRSIVSGKKYETIWTDEGFQFINDHKELARKLEHSFTEDGEDVAVQAAMSFGNPSVSDALQQLVDSGCESITVLPLYPQNAYSQAYIVADAVYQWAHRVHWQGELIVIGDYSENLDYLQAVADCIRESGFDPASDDRLIFGFHSIPKIDVANGDTYEAMSLFTCEWLAREIGVRKGQWSQGFQCRFDEGRKWLEPYSHEILDKWWNEGFTGRIFYICPNFSVDCLETYYDVEGVMKVVWLGRKVEAGQAIRKDSFTYIPCLGKTDRHVKVIRSVLENPANFIV